MANIAIYDGTSRFYPGSTPFGFYDNDYQFQTDADKVVTFCARRLGYPIENIELQDINFYAAFEEAVTTYGNEIYAYKVRQDYLSLEGTSRTTTTLNTDVIQPNLSSIIRMSQQYGEEAGVGGTVTWYTGSLLLTHNKQDYDLNQWAQDSASISSTDRIEIKRVFYESTPAIVRYFDPYAGSGLGLSNMLDQFGFGASAPAVDYMLMPLNFDIQRIQAIELNDAIRKSQFSFELVNNVLRIFPIPKEGKLRFEYIKNSERNSITAPGTSGGVSNVSNVPYKNPTYTEINSIGRQWIFEYTLSIVKEVLGYVRGKYGTIPIPGAEVTLNHADLITAATAEKGALLERLRGYLEDTSREKLLERRALEADYKQKELNLVPQPIFIG
jgi:hypothetical protein|tara:strand:- start:3562 stop:4713 length:1152 start_codon:yes stop_codon:yes gene_type:complete